MDIVGLLLRSGDVISQNTADFINHNLGNIKTDGCIKQYLFVDGDNVSDVVCFLEKYYPEYAKSYKIRKGIV